MSFFYGTPDPGRLLLELLSDDVIDGPEQNLACALYNAICTRIDARAAA